MSPSRTDPSNPRPRTRRNIPAVWLVGTLAMTTVCAAVLLTGCAMNKSATSVGLPGRARHARPAAAPGSLPSLEEEVWVIARSRATAEAPAEETPGSGALYTEVEEKQIPVPLKHTDVQAAIDGYIATVRVTQQFHNPYDQKIEAVYVFPLPENAAVHEFIMVIGDRRIRGIIRERQEAERIYHEAKQQGYVASLLTQERPNLFTQSVANIEPGKALDVNITYFQTLAYDDGWHEFVFPIVVGPRFNPPDFGQGVGAVGRGRQGSSGQKTEVSYLRPNQRSGHDIALAVIIRAGMPIEEVLCRSHRVEVAAGAEGETTVRLSADDTIPNKDFVLRYRLAGSQIKAGFLTQREDRGTFFTLMLYPPAELARVPRQPLELVFVIDSSGSMHGAPIAQAKAAIQRALHRLEPGDSFQLINFATTASALGPAPLEATAENVQRGLNYLAALEGSGGTMMIEGVKAALNFPHDPRRLRFVVFLTDGYIGNEAQILREIQLRLGESRIFSFGVGAAPHRYLLEHMAKLGRGAVAYLGLKDDAGQVMNGFFERVSHPALTDLRIDWGGLQVADLFPHRLPDLFVGRPVIVTGRCKGESSTIIRATGRAGGKPLELALPVPAGQSLAQRGALPSVWARMKISDLSDQSVLEENAELAGQIKQVALDYGLMSAYTAFVAVDSSARTAGDTGTTVPVPVPVPEGVQYKTTIPE